MKVNKGKMTVSNNGRKKILRKSQPSLKVQKPKSPKSEMQKTKIQNAKMQNLKFKKSKTKLIFIITAQPHNTSGQSHHNYYGYSFQHTLPTNHDSFIHSFANSLIHSVIHSIPPV